MFCWCTKCSILNNNWSFEARKFAWNGQYFPIHWILDCDLVNCAKSFVVSTWFRNDSVAWERICELSIQTSFDRSDMKAINFCACVDDVMTASAMNGKERDWWNPVNGPNDGHHKQFKIHEPKQSEGDQKIESVCLSFQLTTFSISKIDFSFRQLNAVLKRLQTERALNLTNRKRKMFYWHLASDFHVRDFQS